MLALFTIVLALASTIARYGSVSTQALQPKMLAETRIPPQGLLASRSTPHLLEGARQTYVRNVTPNSSLMLHSRAREAAGYEDLSSPLSMLSYPPVSIMPATSLSQYGTQYPIWPLPPLPPVSRDLALRVEALEAQRQDQQGAFNEQVVSLEEQLRISMQEVIHLKNMNSQQEETVMDLRNKLNVTSEERDQLQLDVGYLKNANDHLRKETKALRAELDGQRGGNMNKDLSRQLELVTAERDQARLDVECLKKANTELREGSQVLREKANERQRRSVVESEEIAIARDLSTVTNQRNPASYQEVAMTRDMRSPFKSFRVDLVGSDPGDIVDERVVVDITDDQDVNFGFNNKDFMDEPPGMPYTRASLLRESQHR